MGKDELSRRQLGKVCRVLLTCWPLYWAIIDPEVSEWDQGQPLEQLAFMSQQSIPRPTPKLRPKKPMDPRETPK
jgi:hypothetical protein